jgi:predicted nucleotidyltransferase
MNTNDPNLPLLESVVKSLGTALCEQFVFVGGCVTGLLITESAAPPVRVTKDVDAIVEIVSLTEYHALERQLEGGGFRHDRSPDAPICRWTVGGALLDVMPSNESVLGFGNRWYSEAIRTAMEVSLPSGQVIRLISPPAFLGTKLEAFHGRGAGDFLASHDLEDIITLVDGRPELSKEVCEASLQLREYLFAQIRALLQNDNFLEALPAHLLGDAASQARLPELLSRLRALAR